MSEVILSIVSVNWNSGRLLGEMLKSLTISTPPFSFEVIVVDNNSSDESLDLAVSLPNLKIMKSDENLGFGKACNWAAREAVGKYLLFLNPDTRLEKDTLSKAMARLESGVADVVGVQLYNQQGIQRSCARFPSFLELLSTASGVAKAFPKAFRGINMLEWSHNKTAYVDHVIGAFYFLKKNDFLGVGGFDPRYFLYFEDLDLSKKLRDNGKKILYVTEARAFHEGGGTSKNIKAHRLFLSLKSRSQFVKKWFTCPQFYSYLLIMFLLEGPLRVLECLKTGNLTGPRNILVVYVRLFPILMKRDFQ